MPSWTKSNGANTTAKEKPAKKQKQQKAQMVITMPRRHRDFGVDTFGNQQQEEPISSAIVEDDQSTLQHPPPTTLLTNNTHSPHSTKDLALSPTSLLTTVDATKSARHPNSPDHHGTSISDATSPSQPSSYPRVTPHSPLENNSRTPGTPATSRSAGLLASVSTKTSYFPTTPSSDNSVATHKSTKTISSTTFGDFGAGSTGQQLAEEAKEGENIHKESSSSSFSTPELEKGRPRLSRHDLPPAIVTAKGQVPMSSSSSSTTKCQALTQTPLSPHTPALLTVGHSHQHVSAPSALNSTADTPKTPSSMNEWRMMQMHLQQQEDDLPFPTTSLPLYGTSFPSARPHTPSTPTMNGLARGTATAHLPATTTSAYCCYNSNNHMAGSTSCAGHSTMYDSTTSNPITSGATSDSVASGAAMYSATNSFGAKMPGTPSKGNASTPKSPVYLLHSNHSFLNSHHTSHHPSNHIGCGGLSTLKQQQQETIMYNQCNSSGSSSDFFSSREQYVPVFGSTATIGSEHTPSTGDLSDFDVVPPPSHVPGTVDRSPNPHPHPHHLPLHHHHHHHHHHQLSYAPCRPTHQCYQCPVHFTNSCHKPISTVRTSPHQPRRLSIVANAVVGSATGGLSPIAGTPVASSFMDAGTGATEEGGRGALVTGAGSVTATTPATVGEAVRLGGVEMEHSVSGSSSASCSVRTASPGPFRSLSSKWMTVNTIKKLSGGGSGSHHSAGASGMNENQQQKTLLRNNSKDNLSDACNESGVGPEAISAVVDTTEISIGNHGGDLGGDPMSAHTTISEGVQISGNCCCCGCHPISVSERDGASSAFNYDTDFGVNGNSTGSNKQNGAINNNKVQRMQNKLSGLRKKEKSKSVSSRKGKDSSSNTSISSELMMDDYSQYNYERQIEDFQRAARIFKEQKDLSTEAMLADAKAAVAEASAAAAAAAAAATAASVVMDGGSKLNLSAPSSLVVSPIQELSEEETMSPAVATPMAGEEARTTTIKPEKPRISGQSKSYTHPTYPSYRGDEIATPLSPQPPRRATASNISSSSRASPRKSLQPSQTSILRGIHSKGKNDSAYLESDQIGQDSILDLKLPRLGLASGFGGGFGVNSTTSGSPTSEYSALDLGSPRSNSHPSLRALSTRPEDGSRIRSDILDDIPLEDMVATPSSLGKGFPKRYEDGYSFKGRLSISSQQQPTAAAETMRGRSLHSVCSVDSVSQQIAARHQQNGRVHNLSNVASLHSQYADSMGCISASGSVGAMGPSEAMGNNGATAGACPTADMDMVLENSPIQVVRATVSNVDDTSLPCFTFRMWVLSTIFVIMGAAISEYNFFRTDSAYFSIYFVQLASYFCGKAMARWLPTRTFEIRLVGFGWIADKFRTRWGKRSTAVESTPKKEWDECNNQAAVADDGHYNQYISRDEPVPVLPNTKESQSPDQIRPRTRKSVSWKFTLNPGKFNMKEHMLIGIAAAAGCSPAYATNVLAIQDLIFNTPLGTMTGMGLVVSSQCIGFSMAWFLFDYVIKPSVMVWPATLVNVALYNTLHEHKVLTRWFTRMQLFWYAFFAVFIYQWFPRMFMPLLASMSFLCWVQPSSNVLRKLGSGYTGLGIGCISLDWSIISGVGPLYTPWWAQCNFFVGLILMLWIITPLVYFSDYWSALSYPIVSANLYDNTSELYDINRVVNKDLSFNKTMFEEYSPVIMTPYFAITYGTSFMAVIATFVHVALYYGSDIWLIAQVRFLRRISRLQEKPWVQRITGTVQGWAIVNLLCGSHADHDDDLPSVGLNTQSTVDVGSRTCLQNSRRNSEPPRFQDGGGLSEQPGVPLNTSNTGAASVDGLSAHRRQYSQGDGFLHISKPKATPRKATKVLDDQDQIPTEMFGTEDVHTRLMRNYSEIPGMWFGILLLVCFAMAIAVCISSEINLPVYALILALVLAAVFALPMAIIQALSSSQIGLNVLSEVVCGYLLPGNQLGNSVFKCYSYMALYQCLNLTQSFKLGHYMKVPPRQIFIMVVYGTLVGAFINLQVLDWVMLYNRDDLFSTDPRNGWSFRNLDLFFSASLLWGAISPTRLFSDGSIYHFLPYCFLIGAFIPIPCYLMYRHFPPYGTLCKGTTRSIPLLPKCKCPIPPQQPQSSPDATNGVVMNPTAVSAGSIPLMTTLQSVRGISSPSLPPPPPPLLGRRRLSEMLTDLEKNEGGRSFWPASPTVLSRSQVHDLPSPGEGFTGCRSTDGSSSYPPLSPTTAVGDPEGEVCSPASRGVSMMDDSLQQPQQPQRNTTIERTHSIPVEPHVYYGRPGSVWDHRLRRVPWHLVNMPLICVGASFVPQAPASFVMSAGIVAFCFAFLVLRYHHEWWRRYTFVLAAALDAGTQICNMAIFVVFSLILKGSVGFPAWFGNDPTNPERCGVGDGYN